MYVGHSNVTPFYMHCISVVYILQISVGNIPGIYLTFIHSIFGEDTYMILTFNIFLILVAYVTCIYLVDMYQILVTGV